MFKFLKQFFIYGIASVLGKIAAVFLLPLYTNVLTQDEYGALAMITATKGIFDLFSNLNIHSGVARDYHEKDIDRIKVISTGFFSIIFFSLLFMCILLLTKDFWINKVLNIENYDKAFVFMLLTIPAGSLFSYFAILTRYKQKAVLYSIGSFTQLTIQIVLTVYFILVLKTGIVGVFYGILAGEFVGIVYFYFLNIEYIKFYFCKSLLNRVLKYSLPTLPAIAAIWADSNIGQLLIGKYISLSDAGIYSIALRVSSVYLLIRHAFSNVWLPFVYENLNKSSFEKDVIKIFNAATISLLLVSLNISILSDNIVLILSTPDYLDAGNLLILLTIPMSISILNQFTSIGPNISRKTKYISFSNISGSIVNLTGLAFFLPKYGVIVVPFCLMLSSLIVFFLTAFYTNKEINLQLPVLNALIITLSIIFIYTFKHFVNSEKLQFSLLIFLNIIGFYYIYRKYDITSFVKKT